jgi:hypothetical protein
MTHQKTSPAVRERSRRASGEGEGDRVGTLYLLRADPITLTLGASRLDLSRAAGEVSRY